MFMAIGISLWFAIRPADTETPPPPTPPPSPSVECQTAHALGLSPESLAAANVSAEQAQGLLARLLAAEQLRDQWAQAGQAASDAAGRVTTAIEQLRGDPASTELGAALTQGRADLAAADALTHTVAESLVTLALQDLGAEAVTAIQHFRVTTGYVVPPESRAASLSSDDWSAYEAALVAERRADRLGEELSARHAQILSQVRTNSDVIQARQRMDALLPQLRVVFE
ncbi:MAG: hypothetical protein AB7O77_15945 [Phycisphaerales bacterium]